MLWIYDYGLALDQPKKGLVCALHGIKMQLEGGWQRRGERGREGPCLLGAGCSAIPEMGCSNRKAKPRWHLLRCSQIPCVKRLKCSTSKHGI